MKYTITTLFALLLILHTSSRPIFSEKQADALLAEIMSQGGYRFSRPDEYQAAQSTANPVQGIANATSGYLSLNDDAGSKLFYVFYQCRNMHSTPANQIPLIIWLEGGPGSSGMTSAFYEMGPYTLNSNSSGQFFEQSIPVSWTDNYHMMFIDYPRGTGYSVAGNYNYVNNSMEAAQDFLTALLNFYQLAPFQQFVQTPLFIFGESFAGHYIPAITTTIINYNNGQPAQNINLQGIGIGNPWTDPINELKEFGMHAYVMGLADDIQRSYIEYLQLDMYFSILNGANAEAGNDMNEILAFITGNNGGLNWCNYRQFGSYNYTGITNFMNSPNTCQRYNIDSSACGSWIQTNPNISKFLVNDIPVSYAQNVVLAIESNLKVMFYDGQDDLIVNGANAQNWIGALNWPGQQAFYNAPLQPWFLNNGTVGGFAKQYENLLYVSVNKAGHLVPRDQLNSSTEMLGRYMLNCNNWTAPINFNI